MPGLRNQVLIYEDDESLAKALSEAFRREGIAVHAISNAHQAKELLQQNQIGYLFVDCLLPDTNGIDFVNEIRKEFPPSSLDVILMSGIFTDSATVKESMRSTQAKAFLKKPFPIAEALAYVDKSDFNSDIVPVSADSISPRKKLYQLFSKPKVTVREKVKALSELDVVHGYDLPFILSLLVETKASGYLNIVFDDKDLCGVTFAQGNIVNVDIPDKETFLGKLLIESGFIDADSLNEGIALPSGSVKKLGERLVRASYISPHALEIVLQKQMNIRLSKSIVDRSLKCNFVESEVDLRSPFVDAESFAIFLHDWIASKITMDWLKAHYTQWLDSKIQVTNWFASQQSVLSLPLISGLDGVVDYLLSGKTISEMLHEKKYPEEILLKALHLLLTKGMVVLKDESNSQQSREVFLSTILEQFSGKDRFEIFEVIVAITKSDLAKPDPVAKEFLKIIGPKPAPEQGALLNLWTQVHSQASQAFDAVKSGQNSRLKGERNEAEAVIIAKAHSMLDEARRLLMNSQFKQANEIIKKVQSTCKNIPKLKLHLIWSVLGMMDGGAKNDKILQDCEVGMIQIPPDEKFDAAYFMVMGLISKQKDDTSNAKKHFEKAISLDTNFISAKRELSRLKPGAPKKDLSDLVGSFFQKK